MTYIDVNVTLFNVLLSLSECNKHQVMLLQRWKDNILDTQENEHITGKM